MSSYVLFSPLGFTDPSRGGHDSAFLHIMRHYRPSAAYLFMTSGICELDEKLNLYEIMAEKLCRHLGFECKIIKYKHPEIVNPHVFDEFYGPFEGHIREIAEENPGSQIIINVSSGTPAMKEACKTIAAVSNLNLLPVQVSSPENSENRQPSVDGHYNAESEWENLAENFEDLECPNRCTVITLSKSHLIFAREISKAHIKNYDYSAAREVAGRMEGFLNAETANLIKAAHLRLSFRPDEAKNIAGPEFFPVQTEPARSVYEYILILNIKLRKSEYQDYLRALSPVITNLFIGAARYADKFFIEHFCVKDRKGIYNITPEKLAQHGMLEYYNGYFSEKYRCNFDFKKTAICANNILPFIQKQCGDEKIKNLCLALRGIEENARNTAAHDMVTITDGWIKTQTGHTTDEIQNFIRQLFMAIFRDYTKPRMWNAYEEMNSAIIQGINQSTVAL